METLEKKITPNEAIIMMLSNINSDNKGGFYKIVEQYCQSLSKDGNAYHRIKNALRHKPLVPINMSELSHNLKKLIMFGNLPDENVFLNEHTTHFVDRLLLEWRNVDSFRYHNLNVRNKILFYGETGNGKTTIARHIAKLINLPFVEINSDIVIDSHLGSTGQNIHNIFNQLTMPCVLFWDEIDSIGKKRGSEGDSGASHENDRMVNSMLINIEKMSNDIIFIGATNRYEILDTAFLRRFDEQFKMTAPIEEEKLRFAEQLKAFYKMPSMPAPIDILTCKNYSEIKQYFLQSARNYVLSTIETD